MYQFSYAEVVDESPREMRARERHALDTAIALLSRAQTYGPGTREMTEALSTLSSLWSVFLDDLRNPANELPLEVRAGLISIGIWVNKEIVRLGTGETRDVAALIEINQIIRNGLA